MIGPSGTGKTLLAHCLPSLFVKLTSDELLEISRLYSLAGQRSPQNGNITERPFRSPSFSLSPSQLLGRPSTAQLGELLLAQYGVLLFDELPEFSLATLAALRQPLQDQRLTFEHHLDAKSYRLHTIFVATANACPCGNLLSAKICNCTIAQLKRHQQRLNNALTDRIDLQIITPPVSFVDRQALKGGSTLTDLRQLVARARSIQALRYQGTDYSTNSQLQPNDMKHWCTLDRPTERFLDQIGHHYQLSARAVDRLVKVARTIADLVGEDTITASHLSEACQYRLEHIQSG